MILRLNYGLTILFLQERFISQHETFRLGGGAATDKNNKPVGNLWGFSQKIFLKNATNVKFLLSTTNEFIAQPAASIDKKRLTHRSSAENYKNYKAPQ